MRVVEKMINYIYAYEIVALFLIGLVTFFYHYKNWLPLYRNRFFSDLLHILLGVVTIELVKRLGESGLIRLSNSVSVILTAFSFAGVIVASVLFWLYYLAQTFISYIFKKKSGSHNVYTCSYYDGGGICFDL